MVRMEIDKNKFRHVQRDGIVAILINNNKVLLLKRRRIPFLTNPGIWFFITGGRKNGEAYIETAYREIMEETGLQISVGALVGFAERIGRPGHQVIMSFFALWGGDGRAVAASDASEVAWVPLSEVESFGLVEGLADFLRRAGII